eukprot:8457656-Lingulodinium_polyedra.AAC.1
MAVMSYSLPTNSKVLLKKMWLGTATDSPEQRMTDATLPSLPRLSQLTMPIAEMQLATLPIRSQTS